MTVTIREPGENDLEAILALHAQPEIDDGVLLSVEDSARERAHAFYEALGFTRQGFSFAVELENAA